MKRGCYHSGPAAPGAAAPGLKAVPTAGPYATNPMRVLLVNDLPPAPGSGAEMHLLRLGDALKVAGEAVGYFAGEVRHRGAARLLDLWDPFAQRKLAQRVETFRPDVIHFHNVLSDLSPAVLGASASTASVLSVHDMRLVGLRVGPQYGKRPGPLTIARGLKDRFGREVARRRIDVVTGGTEVLAERLRAVGFERVRVLPYFVPDIPDVVTPPGDDVVFAGRLSVEKGAHVLVRAFGAVAARHPSSHLHLAGDGPQRAELEALADRLAPGQVTFAGLVGPDRVRELMQRARVVCVPSITVEVAPLVITEAALSGRAVVANDRPSERELLADGELGLLVPAGDPTALSGALDRLLGDAALAERFGTLARAAALKRHSPEAAVAAHRAVYDEAIEIRNNRGGKGSDVRSAH
jgi:glycosyltransferase involved in cell wall biosynthesis